MSEVFYISAVPDAPTPVPTGTSTDTAPGTYHHKPAKPKQQDAVAATIAPAGSIFCLELTGQATFGYRCCPGIMRDVSFPPKSLVKAVDPGQTAHLLGYHAPLSSFFGFSLDSATAPPFLSDAKASYRSFGHERVTALAASPDGAWVVAGDALGRLVVWRVGAEGDIVAVCDAAHLQAVSCIAFSTDGSFLATGGADAIVKIWSFHDLFNAPSTSTALLYTFTAHSAAVTGLAFGLTAVFGQGRVLASSADGSVSVFDLCDGQLLARFTFPEPVTASVWSADETLVIAGAQSGSIYLIDISSAVSNVERQLLQKHTAPVNVMLLSFDERLLISGGADGLVVFWDLVTRQPIKWHSVPKSSITNILIDFKDPTNTSAMPARRVNRNNHATINAFGPFKRIGSEVTDLTVQCAVVAAENQSVVLASVPDPIQHQLAEENCQLRAINIQLCTVIEKMQK